MAALITHMQKRNENRTGEGNGRHVGSYRIVRGIYYLPCPEFRELRKARDLLFHMPVGRYIYKYIYIVDGSIFIQKCHRRHTKRPLQTRKSNIDLNNVPEKS